FSAGSVMLAQTIHANSTALLASSASPALPGQSVTLTATASPTSPGTITPVGIVTFFDGATQVGQAILDTSGHATLPWSSTVQGNHSLSVVFGGDSLYNGSTAALTQAVLANTSTTGAADINPSVSGQTVTFTATVTISGTGSGTPTGTVTFYDGGVAIGTGTLNSGSPDIATYSTNVLSTGPHTITAAYTSGDANFNPSPTSAPITQTVNKADTTTTVVSSLSPTVTGQSVIFTATVSISSPGSN